MIRNVLFDLDDTLFDFHKAEKIALTKTLVHFGIDPTEETLALYSTINAAHWKRLELGEISREEVKVGRYRELFKTIGVECDPVNIVSNGTAKVQEGRIGSSGIAKYMDGIFISQILGESQTAPQRYRRAG